MAYEEDDFDEPPARRQRPHRAAQDSADLLDDPLHRPSSFGWRPARSSTRNQEQHPSSEQPHCASTTQRASDTPVIGNIPLVSTHSLPDRFRNVFNFPLFNAVQSKCFDSIYNSEDNFVLSSPTGSGKTAIFELAICHLVNTCLEGSFKVVYQAPTKSLCAERQRDWHNKFAALNLQVAELTGDVQNAQLRNVQHATIIITTPEKWDSITRKWKDHKKLMQMVKLFLIDEVHTLKDDRDAVLEVIVSRMKSVGSGVRFIALSATMPNIQDISTWLGRSSKRQDLPALQETFGEEFRPVRITKHVCGYASRGNEFAFDKALNDRIPEVITMFSKGKPILIFCFTRAACVETAKHLTQWLSSAPHSASSDLMCENKDLQATVRAGVAFHHAGLSATDRAIVEKAYLSGNINLICCTSTLAAGINLPCHMVIIKNTITYAGTGCKEYSDLEIMQMLGRAGRPQFGDSAIAVIMTRQQQVLHYESLVSGQETIESRLHLNLIDHLNAEIGLGTICSESTATAWLCSTFLYVRLRQNPHHYKLGSDRAGSQLEQHLTTICSNGIDLLRQHQLVTGTEQLNATAFGDAMSRYCVQFETMQLLLSLKRGARTSEILTVISQAAEFKEIYFRSGEKTTYRQWNNNPLVKFPLKVHIDAPWHKVFLVIQVVLAGSELPDAHREQRQDFNTAKSIVFQHALRLIRCVYDCVVHLEDAVAARHALALGSSLSAHIWDDSTLHMSQLEGLGTAGVRKLVTGGIKTMEELANAEPHRLEQLLTRNPPFGSQLREKAESFPRLAITMQIDGQPEIRTGVCIALKLIVTVTFANSKPQSTFRGKALQMSLLVDTPDGQLLHFRRLSASHILHQPALSIEIRLSKHIDLIRAQAICDDYAGTARSASLRLQLTEKMFQLANVRSTSQHATNMKHIPSENLDDEFDDCVLDDNDLIQADNVEQVDLYDLAATDAAEVQADDTSDSKEPTRLENGKWSCRHTCKDKTSCKHLCCREGLDKKPKMSNTKTADKQRGPQQSQAKTTGQKEGYKNNDKKQGLQQSQLKISRKRSEGGTDQSSLMQTMRANRCRSFYTEPHHHEDLEMHDATYNLLDEYHSEELLSAESTSRPAETLDDCAPQASFDWDMDMTASAAHSMSRTTRTLDHAIRSDPFITNRGSTSCIVSANIGKQQAQEHTVEEAFDIVRSFLGDELFSYVDGWLLMLRSDRDSSYSTSETATMLHRQFHHC